MNKYHPVSAQALYDNPDTQGYIYTPNDFGLDEWISITGVDANKDETVIILEYGSTGEKKVSPDYIVYVNQDEYCITNEEKAEQRWQTQ